jgi:hypothetical protein
LRAPRRNQERREDAKEPVRFAAARLLCKPRIGLQFRKQT